MTSQKERVFTLELHTRSVHRDWDHVGQGKKKKKVIGEGGVYSHGRESGNF